MRAGQLLRKRRLLLGLRCLLGGIFLFAAVPKILAPEQFASAIMNYRLVPDWLVNGGAIVIPWVEAGAALLLIAGVWVRANALVFSGLLAGFLGAIISALARGLNIECGCFGTVAGHRIGLVHLVLDAALLATAILLFRGARIGRVIGEPATA
jgi:putative oxidoreductase